MTDLPSCCQQALLDGFSLAGEHKPWRVAVPQFGSTFWHTQKEALDQADACQTAGFWVTVRYWRESKWEHYATFEPAEQRRAALVSLSELAQEGGPQK